MVELDAEAAEVRVTLTYGKRSRLDLLKMAKRELEMAIIREEAHLK